MRIRKNIIIAATVFVLVEVEKYILMRREASNKKIPVKVMGI